MQYFIFIIALMFVSCGTEEASVTPMVVISPSPYPVVSPSPEPTDIENIVADENEYREELGQSPLTLGLSCTLYSFTGGSSTTTLTGLSSMATFLLNKEVNQPEVSVSEGLNLLPMPLKDTKQTNYLLRCTGSLVIVKSGYHELSLTSDDASVLYVDGTKTVDNDGAHGTTTVAVSKFLRRAVHTVRLDYVQFGGQESLILNMDKTLLPSNVMYH